MIFEILISREKNTKINYFFLAPPMPAEPAAAPVPVIEQESVLDLSLQR